MTLATQSKTLDAPAEQVEKTPSTSKKRTAAEPAVAGDAPPAVAAAKAVDAPIGASAAAGSAVLPLHTQAQDFDREIRAAVGRATGSLSVASALLAGIDWAVNLLLKSAAGERRLDPDAWLAAAPDNQGSWWPAWHEWLAAHSGDPVDPPRMGLSQEGPLDDAPGRYVLEK